MGHTMPKAFALRQAIEKAKRSAVPVSRLLTIDEACTVLRVSKWTIYRLIRRNEIKSIKVGRRRLIPLQSIEHFITQLQAEGAA